MSVMMGAVPVYAAGSTDTQDVYKEETVYVNADATGNSDEVTVSDWLKNSGSVSGNLTDESILKEIKNVKGDETFTENGDQLTWNTAGEDIYYQGTTDKELPVSVKLTYFLDGKEVKPDELKGKSGHLKIQVQYTNNEKKTVTVDGKEEEVYTPFVMMTGMILPNETFSNVTIDNGKVISDGSRNIVVGFGMPGLKDSLDMDEETTKEAEDKGVTIPENFEMEADVTDFTMSSTFTVALTDLLDDMDMDNIIDVDSLKDSLNELEDAALELVSGSGTLADGASTLADGVSSYTAGADELNAGIQKYLGSNGELNGSVTEYVNGVGKVVKGVKDYTSGTNALANGVTSYVAGEQKIAAGAAQLSQLSKGLEQVQTAVDTLSKAADGKGEATDDLVIAANQLAAGTKQLQAVLGSEEVTALLTQVNGMVTTGNELISATESLSASLQTGIATPVANIAAALTGMETQLNAINTQLGTLQSDCETAVADVNAKITDYNTKVDAAQAAANTSKTQIANAISALQVQLNATTDESVRDQISTAITALQNAQTAADGLNNVQKASAITVSVPTFDLSAITSGAATLQTNLKTFKETAAALQQQLPEMQKKLDAIAAAKDSLPSDSISQLTASVTQLNQGMQGLNTGLGTLSGGLGQLNTSVQAQFPTAIQGITELNGGFMQLGSYNTSLLSGAEKLKGSSSTLAAGAGTLQSGTNQLASGLNTLGSQMSAGAAKLSANSNALREGASSLSEGAKKLADGMDQFDKEGTSKLKSTVEDEFGDVLDRLKALTSDDCTYNTFSGKDSKMDGSVKFVIETEAIE
jgi:putative membrane protein